MLDRRFIAEAAALVAAAILCAAVANFIASRERKLAWVGDYPNWAKVPEKKPDAVQPSPGSMTSPIEDPPATDAAPPVSAAPAISSTAPVLAKGATPVPAPASKGGATSVAPAAAPAKSFPPHPDRPFLEVSGDDVWQLYDRKALFLDARRTTVFAEGHIRGARSFAVWESDVDDKVNALAGEGLDPDAPIIVYCAGGACEDSHMLSEKLFKVGFNNALVYKDGFPDWQKRGGAVERGGTQ